MGVEHRNRRDMEFEMTSNNALKKAARERAAKTGVSYTQARRELVAEHEARQAGAEGVEQVFANLDVTWVEIQQDAHDDEDGTPLPLTIDQYGFVGNQDFWRGAPWRLMGFVVDADQRVVDLDREVFFDDPRRGVGMHPIFMDRRERGWATWRGEVETVRPRKMQALDPRLMPATFHARTPAGERSLTVGVGHLLKTLRSGEVEQMRGAFPEPHPAADDLLSVLCMSGDAQALDFSAFFDDVDEGDIDLRVALDHDDYDAWVAAGRGYQPVW